MFVFFCVLIECVLCVVCVLYCGVCVLVCDVECVLLCFDGFFVFVCEC